MSSFSAHLPVNLQAEAAGPGLVAGIILDRVARWLALARGCPYWMKPVHGTTGEALPSTIHCLLWKRSGGKFGGLLRVSVPQGPATIVPLHFQ